MHYLEYFTEKAKAVIAEAMSIAMELGHIYVGSEHILCGLLKVENTLANHALSKQGVTYERIYCAILCEMGRAEPSMVSECSFTPRFKRIIENVVSDIKSKNYDSFAGTEQLLIALINEKQCYAFSLLKEAGVNFSAVHSMCDTTGAMDDRTAQKKNPNSGIGLESFFGCPTIFGSPEQAKDGNALNMYGRDLTELARQKKLDEISCREDETERIIQILLRRRKNNPCLIGEGGVGKTAVVEGLALRIADGRVPDCLKGKRVFMLDVSSLVAGARYRGDFEERIKNALDEVKSDGNIILFIDEIHSIMGAGAAEGAIDAATILKPLLARGELQLIGATTINEYRKYIEKDAALERRFQPVIVDEPSEQAALEILFGLRGAYEEHHGVKIADDAIRAAVSLSVRYINDRFLPDKAIDLIDEAASSIRLGTDFVSPEYKALVEERLQAEKEKINAFNACDFKKAKEIYGVEVGIAAKLNELAGINSGQYSKHGNGVHERMVVSADDIARIVTKWTGIPVNRLQEDEAACLLNMEKTLERRVVGQKEAVYSVVKAIKRGRTGLKALNRPVGSFIFMGPTGVGKTELCKALAEALFGNESALIRFDMSEYMEKHAVAKLIGSPPGYVGFGEGGQLTERIRRNPYSIVLFDEIEKAHPDLSNILLQILEDGVLTASDGRKVSFKNAVIIMTSNIGANTICEKKKTLGFTGADVRDNDYEGKKQRILNELKQAFKPEFINRIDDIIIFNRLAKEATLEICEVMLNKLALRLQDLGYDIRFDKAVIEKLTELGYDEQYGARPLRRVITSKIEDMLAQCIIENKINKGCRLRITTKENEFYVKTSKAKCLIG